MIADLTRVVDYPIPVYDWQFLMGGLLMGRYTPYRILHIDGLSLPNVRSQDSPRQQAHGSWGARDTSDVRDVTFDFNVTERPGDPPLPILLANLRSAWSPSDVDIPMSWRWPGYGNMFLVGRPRKLAYPIAAEYGAGKVVGATAQFTALDPILYSAELQQVVIGDPTTGDQGGLAFNSATYRGATFMTADFVGAKFGAAGGGSGSPGYAVVRNNGTVTVAPVTVIKGPCTNPIIERVQSGEKIILNIVLGASDYIELDHDLRSVILNGVASRQDAVDLRSSWWKLPPGASTLHYRATGGYTGSSATISWRHGWW